MSENNKVTTINGTDDYISKPEPITEAQLQNDFDYYIAQKMVEVLFEKGLISVDEFNKISVINQRKFSPSLAEIMS